VEITNAVRQGLKEAGFVEGQNVIIQSAFAEGQFDRLPGLAADLAHRHVTVITALGVAAAVAAKRATTTIPVVFYMGEDPVSLGLVPSFNHPGGNLTGVATLSSAVMAKRLELLHEIAPRADAFAVLINPTNPSAVTSAKEAQDAAHALGKSIHIVHASAESEFEPASRQSRNCGPVRCLSLLTNCSSPMPLKSLRSRSGMRSRQATNGAHFPMREA
jgi:putative ABC transport system substrate-binding protein